MKHAVITVVIFLCACSTQASLGLFLSPEQQILNSEMIAVVDIKNVEVSKPTIQRTELYTNETLEVTVSGNASEILTQRASVSLVRALKGKPDKEFAIVHDKRHLGLHPEFKQGRYLVFLQRDKGDIVLTDGQYSLRPVRDEVVEWYKMTTQENKNKIVFIERSLSEVIWEIQSTQKKTKSNMIPIGLAAGVVISILVGLMIAIIKR